MEFGVHCRKTTRDSESNNARSYEHNYPIPIHDGIMQNQFKYIVALATTHVKLTGQ